tara:strand:+ start:1555 stop:2970 length:1416 start_codon:yes stop_codon:yes gene_type:complete
MTTLINILKNSNHSDIFKKAGETGLSMDTPVFLVGGYIRDIILQRDRTDIDIMVEKNVFEFSKKLAKKLNVNTTIDFEKFSTSRIPYDLCEIEIANAREESYNSNSRKPINVKPTSITKDLERRDFTINAIGVSLSPNNFGEIVDPYNGVKDIDRGIITTPADPDTTFIDDPLRMLRAIRFASQLNFKIPDNIKKSIIKNKKRIKIVSAERITAEIIKMLKSDKPSIAFYLLKELELLEYIFPELDIMPGVEVKGNKKHKDVFIHTLEVVDNAARLSDKMDIRFAALVHDIAKPQTKRFDPKKGWTFHGHEEIGRRMFSKIAKRMKLSNELRDYLMLLIKLHLRPIALAKKGITDSAVRRLMFEASDYIDDLMILCRADITTKNPAKINKYMKNFERVEKLMADVKTRDELKAFKCPIDGHTIMKLLNVKEGIVIGKIKTDIENAILDNNIQNSYNAAYEYMMKIKDNYLK